jgi:hypothetical protein
LIIKFIDLYWSALFGSERCRNALVNIRIVLMLVPILTNVLILEYMPSVMDELASPFDVISVSSPRSSPSRSKGMDEDELLMKSS